jgi:hypothetical protein
MPDLNARWNLLNERVNQRVRERDALRRERATLAEQLAAQDAVDQAVWAFEDLQWELG